MRLPALALTLACFGLPAAASAQHAGGGAPPSRTPPKEATQFDFLLGQWDLTVKPKATSLAARLHGAPRLVGTWKAWKAVDGWGLEDEMRIVDGSGNPVSLTHGVRSYDPGAGHWIQSTLDAYRARFTTSTAEWRGGEMLVTSSGTDPEGKPYLSRARYFDITPTSFKMRQDRSADDGKTWDEGLLLIEAKRVAAAAPR